MTQAHTIEALLRMAKEDLARSSLNTAEKYLEQAVLMNNQNAEVFHILGHVYTKKGKFKKAILAFERAIALDPAHTEAAIALSSLYNDVGKYKEGAGVYARAKKRLERLQPGFDPRINQQMAEKHAELGTLYLRYERFIEAHHEFAKALQLEPGSVTSALQMAKCLSRTGDKVAAIALLKKTLEGQPRCIEARIQLGVLFHAQNRLEDAMREWQSAQEIDPENQMVQMYLSMMQGNSPTSPPSRGAEASH